MPFETETPGMQRVLTLFGLTFPPAVFLAATYVGLADSVFAVNRLVGRRLNQPLRKLVRRGYVGLNALVALGLHTALWTSCFTTDACASRPLLERRACLLAASVATLALAGAYGLDRIAVPLLAVNGRTPGYASGIKQRVSHAALLCVLWMCLGEGETLGVVLLAASTSRRALALLPRTGTAYVAALRVYTLFYTARVLQGAECLSSRRLAVAATMGMMVA